MSQSLGLLRAKLEKMQVAYNTSEGRSTLCAQKLEEINQQMPKLLGIVRTLIEHLASHP